MATESFEYLPTPGLLKDRVVLVTGAAGGLGSALSVACARLGATVVLCGRTPRKLEAVYDRIEAAGGPQPAMMPMNLMTATWKEYEDLADTLDREFGRLDGLVHVAAHFKGFARMEDLDPREWLDGLQVNLTAPFTLTRLCLPLLRRSADASVAYVSDEGGRQIKAFHGIYGVSKRAAEAMLGAFALELNGEPQLRFNSYDPGPMRTDLRTRGYVSESTSSLPPPEDRIARLLWLLGPDSRGVTGQTF